jgi:hypothetical protein
MSVRSADSIPGAGSPIAPSITASVNGNNEQPEDEEVLQVTPHVGFALNTKRTTDQSKVFVNILYHGVVSSTLSAPAKTSIDKKGEKCVAYDIILPRQHFYDAVKDETLRDQVSCF